MPETVIRVRVAGIIIEDDSLLMVAHKKDDKVYWLLPGGGVDYGESLEESLKREFLEELNVNVSVGTVALVFDSIDPAGSRHIINICFYCSYESGEYRLAEEKRLHDYKFVTKQEVNSFAMYPPVNEDLTAILNKEDRDVYKREIYKGKLWIDK